MSSLVHDRLQKTEYRINGGMIKSHVLREIYVARMVGSGAEAATDGYYHGGGNKQKEDRKANTPGDSNGRNG